MKKRALSLIEIMIVIFLITLITGTIGYSMRGTLDKGRSFRTEQAKEQLRDLLLICLAEGADADEIAQRPAEGLKKLGLAKDPDKLVLDGWKTPFTITVHANKSDFTIDSKALNNYRARTSGRTSNQSDSEED